MIGIGDLRKLLLTTQFDTQTVVNWVDQAILYCKVGKKITDCRELNITTFHELRHAVTSLNPAGSVATPANDLLGRLLVKLNLNSREELVALTNYTNYPNYTHISEYYTRTARVARDISEEGEQSVFGSREENKDYGELRRLTPKNWPAWKILSAGATMKRRWSNWERLLLPVIEESRQGPAGNRQPAAGTGPGN